MIDRDIVRSFRAATGPRHPSVARFHRFTLTRVLHHYHLVQFFPFFLISLLYVALALTPSVALAADEKSIIGGTIYFDRDRDGRPAGEPGLRGVHVALSGPKGIRRGVSDAKGGYSFDELAAGQYTVSVVPPNGHQLTTPLTLSVRVDGRNANRVIDFGIAAIIPTAVPTATARATATPTVTPTPASASLVQRPLAASSPQTAGDDSRPMQAALDSGARAVGSPAPIIIPSPSPTAVGGRGGIPDGSVQLRAASLEPLRYAAGNNRLAAAKRWENGATVWLGVPFRTQMDGTYFSQVNCGPASLAMAMGAFGISLDPHGIREYVNFISGNLDSDAGTSLDHIARVAREAGLRTLDLYSARGYRTWDLNLVRQHVAQGHPVITLTRYQSLPGNGNSRFDTDHYVVITGLSGDDFIYNDPAFGSNAGYGLLISGPDLERAWVFSTIPGHALALASDGDAQIPDWVRRRADARPSPDSAPTTESDASAVQSDISEGIIGQVPGDQELPTVNADALAMTLLDIIAAPRLEPLAFVAAVDSDASILADEVAEALVLPPAGQVPSERTVRLAEVFVLDPALVVLFVALLGIFLPPAFKRGSDRRLH
ncbi:MAG: C39 family peptidase [Chloroflexota bacterium]